MGCPLYPTTRGDAMLRIGEFAWLAQVTVETLRHYDRLGLLKPDHLDRFTGYRTYALDQLPRLNRILALKDLGLSLEEIARMVDRQVKPDEIRSILAGQQAELENEIQEAQTRLARVAARLAQIDMEGKMPEHEVLIKTVEAQWVASRRGKIPSWDQDIFGPTLTRMFDEVSAYLDHMGVECAGAGSALYHESQFIHIGDKREDPDVEAALPIAKPIAESDLVKVRQLPAGAMAYVVHHGSFAGLPLAKQAIFAWIETSGYHRAGAIREVYLHHDPDHRANEDSPRHVTEVQFPVAKD
jgi:DNA-binding transcriptional MerR regulator